MNLKTFVIAAVLAVGVSGAAMAQYTCPAGWVYAGGVCQRAGVPGGFSNPVSGAVSGTQAGATSGYNAAGPVGAVVGGALGTAGGAVGGAANTVTGVTGAVTGVGRQCAPGFFLASDGHCYPNR